VNWWRLWRIEKLLRRVFKKHDGEAVVAGFLELKARGIDCSGWKIRRHLMG